MAFKNIFSKGVKGCLADPEEKENVVRAVIGNKLYDTSKAQKICDITIPFQELPNIPCFNGFGKRVSVYKGNAEYFVEGYSVITPVDEQWVKKCLGKRMLKNTLNFLESLIWHERAEEAE